jgi:hypothetical protein
MGAWMSIAGVAEDATLATDDGVAAGEGRVGSQRAQAAAQVGDRLSALPQVRLD